LSRPQDKHLIPLTQRSEEEAFAIRSAGGKAMQAKRKRVTEQAYLIGKYAGAPLVDKRTVKKFEKMGFTDDELNRALEITDAIMKGAKKGDPRMIEIYLKLRGEDQPTDTPKQNNLLDAIMQQVKEDISADEIPELQQTAESDADVVGPAPI